MAKAPDSAEGKGVKMGGQVEGARFSPLEHDLTVEAQWRGARLYLPCSTDQAERCETE